MRSRSNGHSPIDINIDSFNSMKTTLSLTNYYYERETGPQDFKLQLRQFSQKRKSKLQSTEKIETASTEIRTKSSFFLDLKTFKLSHKIYSIDI